MKPTTLLLPLTLAAVPALAGAQTITVLVKDLDVVPGVGGITLIDNLAVNNSGTWLVEADTDNPNTVIDSVILRGGALYAQEGDPLAAPVGASIGSFDGWGISAAGNIGWNIFLDGMTTSTDSGVYFNTTLVIWESSISTAPQFSAGTPYIGFFDARINDANQILIMASIDDVAIASTVDRGIVIATVDGTGTLLSEVVIAKEGDALPGSPADVVADFGTTPHNIAFNNLGRAMFFADGAGATATDGMFVIGDIGGLTVVAQEGSPSPIAGRNWELLSSKACDLNDAGDWVIRGNLDGATTDDEVIVKNVGGVFSTVAQEGTTLPAISPFLLQGFGSGSTRIDSTGNVYWLGDWDDPVTTRDTGIFRNGQLLVQEGVTTVGGVVIEFIATVESNFQISPDGRYLIFEGRLQGAPALDAAFMIDLGGTPPVGYCFGDGSGTACPCGNSGLPGNGCANSVNANGGNLAATGTSSLAGDTLSLNGSGMPSSSALYFQGTTQTSGGAGSVFGDGLRCASGAIVRLKTLVNAAGASVYPGPGDPSVSVRGLVAAAGTRTYQVWYRNAAAFCTPSTFNLTNGVQVTWIP